MKICFGTHRLNFEDKQSAKMIEFALMSGCTTIVNSSLENCYVNGLPNESIAKKVIPNRKESHHQENLQAVKAKDFSYIKVELNSYIGNPH